MHLITGFILAALAQWTPNTHRGKNGSELEHVDGNLICDHLLPGRIRLRAADAIRKEAAFARLAAQLSSADNISSIIANPVTGSILIQYDADNINPELLYAVVYKLLGLDTNTEESNSASGVNAMIKSLDKAVLSATGGIIDFRSSALVGIGIYALYRIFR